MSLFTHELYRFTQSCKHESSQYFSYFLHACLNFSEDVFVTSSALIPAVFLTFLYFGIAGDLAGNGDSTFLFPMTFFKCSANSLFHSRIFCTA